MVRPDIPPLEFQSLAGRSSGGFGVTIGRVRRTPRLTWLLTRSAHSHMADRHEMRKKNWTLDQISRSSRFEVSNGLRPRRLSGRIERLSAGGDSHTMSMTCGNDDVIHSGHSVTNAWEHWKNGNEDAQFDLTYLLRGFMLELLRYVQKNRGAKFQAVIDSHGVLNEALRRLLTKAREGQFADIRNRSDLRGKLCVIVKYVLRDEKKRNSTVRRGHGAEVHDMELIKELAAPPIQGPGENFLEEITEKLRGVHKEAMRILERRLEGLTPAEIAAELGMGVRNVQRIMRQMKDAVDGLF